MEQRVTPKNRLPLLLSELKWRSAQNFPAL